MIRRGANQAGGLVTLGGVMAQGGGVPGSDSAQAARRMENLIPLGRGLAVEYLVDDPATDERCREVPPCCIRQSGRAG
jgi:hypothetical protein